MKKITASLLSVVIAGLFACTRDSNPVPDPQIPVDQVEKVAEMNRTLGWKLFREEQLARPDENILISPFSIQTALNMALNGARGNTRAEILDLMGCPNCSVDDLNQLHQSLTTLLTRQSGHPQLTVANGFFYDNNRLSVKIPFKTALVERYDCGFGQVDFNAEEDALAEINAWVKTNTRDKIDKILNNISPMDVAFLINALYFKADWATGFSEQLTDTFPFYTPDGGSVNAAFMTADRYFSFNRNSEFNVVDIPFRDSTYSISFIQASPENTDVDWHLNITAEDWLKMYDGILYSRAMVFFPKFKLGYENDIIQSLKNLGVQDAFSEQAADFTDMGTAANNIFINQIKHKTVLQIDEKGAEGAAVTSIGFVFTSAPPTFWFNRPFVLVLRHIPTNSMIFTGFVSDPTKTF